MRKKNNTTGLLKVSIDGLDEKFAVAEKGYEFGWMACARLHRIVRAKTHAQIKEMYKEALENKNNSFESLYTILEYLMSTRDPRIIDYNKKLLYHIFSGSISGYKVLDHVMDRMYKNL